VPGTQLVGQPDHARQYARHLDDGDRVLAPEGVAPAQAGDEVQGLVGHLRERVRGVQAHRHQQGPHLALEEARHPAALQAACARVVDDEDACGCSAGISSPLNSAYCSAMSACAASATALNSASVPDRPAACRWRVAPHLEELVEVGRHDGQVAQLLEQWHVGAAGLGQHATVELQDGELAVE
jgi:hypothetical protein